MIAPFAVAAGIEPFFVGKPHATMYREAMRRLQVAPPNCCMIGDRPDTDIVGAAKLGLMTVLVRTGRFAPGDAWPDDWPTGVPKPDYDVASLREIELKPLLERLVQVS